MEYGADFKVRVWLETDDPTNARQMANNFLHEIVTGHKDNGKIIELDYTIGKYLIYRDGTQVVF